MKKLKIILFFILILTSYSCKESKQYNNKDIVNNYNNFQSQIIDLKKFYRSIVPDNKFVEIEFDDDTHLFRFGIYSLDSTTEQLILPGFLQWDLKTNSDIVQLKLKTIGWTQNTLDTLKSRLDKANCISIESGDPTRIGYQRRDFGKYYYRIFDKPMPDSLMNFYKQYCAYQYYNRTVVFEWGMGGFGSNGCYPSK